MSTSSNANVEPKTAEELVAVIGLGCVMPDANNVQEFWNNIIGGKNSIREVPKERWDPTLFWDADPSKPDKTYAKIGAFVTNYKFNPLQFRIPPNVAKQLDESQKWALAAVAEAFQDAGYDKKPFDKTRCAVILGNAMGGEVRNDTGLRVQFPKIAQALAESPGFAHLPEDDKKKILQEAEKAFKSHLPEITEDTMPGELSNVIAGRIANTFDLSGKNFTTDAACASSLAAIDAAVHGLTIGDYDMVLTGGVDRSMDIATYVKFSKIGALSGKGSFPFDQRADGFVMGEGCGILLLKRLSDAVRDGDKIRAVLRGVGSSSDAKGKGITAPNIDGQLSCLTRALKDGRVDASTISLVECHGTSTKVGDVVEVQGLSRVFGPNIKRQTIPIGSIKSQVGHLKSAAGAAGLIKIIKAVENKVLPPSINFEVPNPNINWAETPFYVNPKAKPWPEPGAGVPRRAGISSFGFGGTNFHVILEEYAPGTYPTKAALKAATRTTPVADVLLKREPRHRTLEPLSKNAGTEILVIGAATSQALETKVKETIDAVTSGRLNARTFPDFATRTSNDGVKQNLRIAMVVETLNDLADRLQHAVQAVADPKKRMILAPKGIYVGEGPRRGKMAMVFPGQGSQYVDMLRDLSTRFETVKRTLEQIDEVMTPFLGKPITEYIFVDAAKGVTKEMGEEALKQTAVTQPAMLTADLALYRLLNDYGVKPDMVAGHSLGEYAALVAAGVMSLEDACIAVSARGREMANVHVPDLGKMASITADPTTVEKLLKNIDGYVIPANKNCKVQTVIAGASKAVDQAVEMFNKAGISAQHIAVSAAFHSAIVAPAKEPLRRVFERLDIREPKIPLLSNVTADYYPAGADAQKNIIELLSQQVAAAVEWQKQTERMHQDGARLFVEVGPKTVLTTFTKNTLEGKEFVAVGTNHPKKGGSYHFMDALAVLAAWGYPLRFPDPKSPDFSLPAYRDTLDAAAGPAPTQVATMQSAAPDPRLELIHNLTRQLAELQKQVALLAGPAPASAGDGELARRVQQLGLNLDKVVITGVSVGLPGTQKRLFDDENFERILRGDNLIDRVDERTQRAMLDKNIVRLVKSEKGDHRFETIRDVTEVIRLAGRRGDFNLAKDYGVNEDFVDALENTSMMAIAAGIEALKDAGIPLVRGFVKTSTGKFLPGEWVLPDPLQR
ncbi:MAG TPA: type I polyketide synthase, partial [Candidatus Thermoplasmatota archaeon]